MAKTKKSYWAEVLTASTNNSHVYRPVCAGYSSRTEQIVAVLQQTLCMGLFVINTLPRHNEFKVDGYS